MVSKFLTMFLAVASASCFAQSNLLQITSPASGTVVYPNQVVVISVNAGPSVSNIAIVGQDPLGFSQTTNGQSLQFQLTIPSNTTIGPYDVSAVGTANGSLVASPAISLQVDTQNSGSSLATQPSVLRFSAAGQTIPLHVFTTAPDGSQLDITHSVQMSYASQNPQIANVDAQGDVTSVAPGSTYIVVSNSSYTYLVNTKVGQLATMSFPGLGSMLPGSSVTFQWNASSTAQAYWIDVGSTQGGNNYFQSGSLPTTALSQTVNALPTDGSTIYVTLWTEINGQWAYNQYNYMALSPALAGGVITSPAPGSTLTGSSQLFCWTAGQLSNAYNIIAGSTQGGNEYFQSGNIGNVTSYTVNNLPTDGSAVYITLFSLVNGQWLYNEYQYTAFNLSGALGVLTTPTPGSQLTSTTVTFQWTPGTGATGYDLDIGSTLGGNDIYQSGNLGNVTQVTVNNLPSNGQTLYVTLFSLVNGQWAYNQYTYTAFNQSN